MSRSEARRFKELQEENAKLTRLLGVVELEKGATQRSVRRQKILTPARKYEAIDDAVSVGYSVRFTCRVVGVSRAGYYNACPRHQQPSVDKYAGLRSWLVTFAGEHRRWGYSVRLGESPAGWFYLWP
ncbi:hypothetical protein QPX54_11735 [Corynebacterium propinquum]|uniref:Transposase n=1 Tax=Corynebacterium propinquum TaxID=43769 RepID=A0AAP4BVW6_9CORY|nr:hypothetical protein [Corynebacterium propinquum]MDK4327162.1 hypothetical protein [Corynebacterium propinquum]